MEEAAKLPPAAPPPLPVLNTEPGREDPNGAAAAAPAVAPVIDEALLVPGVLKSGIVYHRNCACRNQNTKRMKKSTTRLRRFEDGHKKQED
jgi:hypothetical protein